MFRKIVSISLPLIGIFVGWVAHYVVIHSEVNHELGAAELIDKLLPYSDVVIEESNYSCTNEESINVGDVLSDIVGDSLAYKINPLSASCAQEVCTLVLNYCKPWQSSECGSRVLKFATIQDGGIDPLSFTCLDIP